MGFDFGHSIRGAKFYDNDVPRIATALERLAKAFEVYNDAEARSEQKGQAASREEGESQDG